MFSKWINLLAAARFLSRNRCRFTSGSISDDWRPLRLPLEGFVSSDDDVEGPATGLLDISITLLLYSYSLSACSQQRKKTKKQLKFKLYGRLMGRGRNFLGYRILQKHFWKDLKKQIFAGFWYFNQKNAGYAQQIRVLQDVATLSNRLILPMTPVYTPSVSQYLHCTYTGAHISFDFIFLARYIPGT